MIGFFIVVFLSVPLICWSEDMKSPEVYALGTYLWVVTMSTLGGVVSYMDILRRQRNVKFRMIRFLQELITSAFAGIITFYLCEWANLSQVLTAALVGLTGHMGSRAIIYIESIIQRRINVLIEEQEDGSITNNKDPH